MTTPEDLPEDQTLENIEKLEPQDEFLLGMFQSFDPATTLHELELLDDDATRAAAEPTAPPPPVD